MSISQFIKEIGRGRDGARSLNAEQAQELMALILSGQASDLELGAFCIAMRIKGETPEEMIGFLEAMQSNIKLVSLKPESDVSDQPLELSKPVILIPSYNGARKLPNLTPLLAGALAQRHFPVLVHGHSTEDKRVSTQDIFEKLHWPMVIDEKVQMPFSLTQGQVLYISMKCLSPKIAELLDIRRTIGLRNSSHSLVKILNPIEPKWPVLQLSSYTHPEYLDSMSHTFELLQRNALLFRGTEGEAVADPRRTPKMTGFIGGKPQTMVEQDQGSIEANFQYPQTTDPTETAEYINKVLKGEAQMPYSIKAQIDAIEALSLKICNPKD